MRVCERVDGFRQNRNPSQNRLTAVHRIISYVRRGMDATSRMDQLFYLLPPLVFVASPILIPRFFPGEAESVGVVGLAVHHGPLIGAVMYAAWLVIMYVKGRRADSQDSS